MVLQCFIDEWAARAAGLESRIAREPDGPTWLWHIRLRILRYLISRYADDPAGPGRATGRPVPRAPRAARAAAGPGRIMEVPPRSRETLAPVLEDLEETNRRRRFQQDSGAPPELVWEWWRARWGAPATVGTDRARAVSRSARSEG